MSNTVDSTEQEPEDSVHGYDPEHTGGADHGSLRGYLIGFVLAAVLTVIPFWLVMDGVFSSAAIAAVAVLCLGVAQIFVHLVYFLHLDSASEGGWKLMSLMFAVVLVVIVVGGSVWIMVELHGNMMLDSAAAG